MRCGLVGVKFYSSPRHAILKNCLAGLRGFVRRVLGLVEIS
jgi:hypothetical protein